MPTYVYQCANPECADYQTSEERVVPIKEMDAQRCVLCDYKLSREEIPESGGVAPGLTLEYAAWAETKDKQKFRVEVPHRMGRKT